MKNKKLPAGYYSQHQKQNGTTNLWYEGTNEETLPPFSYWWDEDEINAANDDPHSDIIIIGLR